MSASSAQSPILTVHGLTGPSPSVEQSDTSTFASQPIWSGLDLDVCQGDVVLVRGPSGVGKSTLLKVIANVRGDTGSVNSAAQIYLNGRLPHQGPYRSRQANVSAYRSQVLYVAQRPSLMQGTPAEMLSLVRSFEANRSGSHFSIPAMFATVFAQLTNAVSLFRRPPSEPAITSSTAHGWYISERPRSTHTKPDIATSSLARASDAIQIAEKLGLRSYHWTQSWTTLSGGEAQRMAISIALSMSLTDASTGAKKVKVLLLDEPTSALDSDSAEAVEKLILLSNSFSDIAIVWITHSDEQAARVEHLCAATAKRRVRTLLLGRTPPQSDV